MRDQLCDSPIDKRPRAIKEDAEEMRPEKSAAQGQHAIDHITLSSVA